MFGLWQISLFPWKQLMKTIATHRIYFTMSLQTCYKALEYSYDCELPHISIFNVELILEFFAIKTFARANYCI